MSEIQGIPAVAATPAGELAARRGRELNPSLVIGGSIVAAIVIVLPVPVAPSSVV